MRPAVLAIFTVFIAASAQTPSPQEVRTIVERAYIFAYPMVLMEYTRRGAAVTNRFVHSPAFPDAQFRQVIRPNADTLYSTGWLDLSKEPLMLHVPDTQGRYYLMQFMDAWTETFDVPGKRTTGTGERWFAITGPNWTGSLPAHAQRIDAPTNMVWLLGRTQTNGTSDYETVHAIQRGYLLIPLSAYPGGLPATTPAVAPRAVPSSITPPMQVQRLTAAEFFTTFAQLLQTNPPHKGDEPMMRDLGRIGIVPGKPFVSDAALDDAVRTVAARLAAPDAGSPGQPGKTGWTGFSLKTGRYGTNYNARANVARIGLGALPPEDAIYVHTHQDADGSPLNGAQEYRLHFGKDQTPPVNAFWSLTMYSEDGYFIANPANRYTIGDRDSLKLNPDGSLDLYIQARAPGGEKDYNWLPAHAANFNLSLRMFWPKENAIAGKWSPPAVVRVEMK